MMKRVYLKNEAIFLDTIDRLVVSMPPVSQSTFLFSAQKEPLGPDQSSGRRLRKTGVSAPGIRWKK
jgi:hypothetical protein